MSEISSPRLIGRDGELTTLRERLLAARKGRTSVVFLSGAAGLGKSRVVSEILSHAHDHEVTTVVGHAVPLAEGAMPLGAVAEALRRLLEHLGQRAVEMVGPDRSQLAAVLPEIGSAPTDTVPARIFVAIARVLARFTAERPLVLALEDLHWADRQTLDLLGFLARTVDDQRLLVVATFRPDEVDRAGLAMVVSELERLPHTTHIELSPLSEDDVFELATVILGAPPPSDQLRHVTRLAGGNPFLIEEVLAAGAVPDRPLPSSLRRIVLGRVRDVPDEVRAVLDAVAVAGAVTLELLEAVVDLSRTRLTEAVRAARDRHILIEQDDAFRLRHALLREALEGELLGSQRRALHEALATAISDDPSLAGDNARSRRAQLAHHWHGAGRAAEAYRAAHGAAREAQELGATADALPHLERALTLVDEVAPDERGQLLDEAIDVATAADRSPLVVELARQRLEDDLTVDRAARLQALLAAALFDVGAASTEILTAADRAVDLAPDASPAVRVQALGVGAHTYATLVDQDPAQAVDLALASHREAQKLGDEDLLSTAAHRLGFILGWVGRADEAISVLQDAKQRAIANDDPDQVTAVLSRLHTEVWRRDLAQGTYETLDVVAEGLPWVERLDDAGSHVGAQEFIGWAIFAYLRAGRWDRAEWAVRRFERFPLGPFHIAWRDLGWATLLWMRGELDAAQRLVDRVWAPDVNPRWYHDVLPLASQLAAERGATDEVQRIVDFHLDVEVHAKEESKKLATMLPLVRAEVDAAMASSGRDHQLHAARARKAHRDLHDHLDQFPPPTVGSVQNEQEATTVALADAELSRLDGGDPHLWREAIRRAGFAWWKVYAGLRLVEALTANGDRLSAAAELQAAHDRAAELGAASLVTHLEDLARRARLPLGGIQEVLTVDDLGLTPRETQVLQLLAAGRTNRQIGEVLFITETTASVHVSNILTKLDVNDRYKAAELARQLGIGGESSGTGSR